MSTLHQDLIVVEGILLQGGYTEKLIFETKNLQGRQGDIYLTTYPRSGTTWTQNLLIAMLYGTETLQDENFTLYKEFPYLELEVVGGLKLANQISRNPRMMKNHLPIHLAPQEIFTHRRKNIIVTRNPKATALSYFNFYQNNPALTPYLKSSKLSDFLDRFLTGEVNYGSWWNWTRHWLKHCRKLPENNLLIHYEELHQNFEEEVQRLASFVGREALARHEIEKLKLLTSVEAMFDRLENERNFKGLGVINKGEIERWKKEFPDGYEEKFDEMTRKIFSEDEIITYYI